MKLVWAENNQLQDVMNLSAEESLQYLTELTPQDGNTAFSSTSSLEFSGRIESVLRGKFKSFHALSYMSKLPFKINYDTPKLLGLDRIANVAGAISENDGKPCLVIDIGTCITYDFIDSENNYHGGAISPGIKLRFKSMSDYTSRLPLLNKLESKEVIGKSTTASLSSGVFYGILGEIHLFIEKAQQSFGDVVVVITGGDSFRFEEAIKYTTFANPKLTLQGLNEILKYNT